MQNHFSGFKLILNQMSFQLVWNLSCSFLVETTNKERFLSSRSMTFFVYFPAGVLMRKKYPSVSPLAKGGIITPANKYLNVIPASEARRESFRI